MGSLVLHGREVATYFDVVGHSENDMTGALGWAMSQSARLLAAVVGAVSDATFDPGEARIFLQAHHERGGFTDVEVEVPDVLHLILEAKRGWNLPSAEQLRLYAGRFSEDLPGVVQKIVVLTQWGAESMVERQLGAWAFPYPRSVLGWGDVVRLVDRAGQQARTVERHLLQELATYLRGVADMRDTDSNRVYVVSLGSRMEADWPMNNVEIVEKFDRYFFPATGKRWPKVPPNYFGFRYGGRLRSIRHVDGYIIDTDMSRHFPGVPSREWDPHYVLTLGPAIRPDHEVGLGPSVQQSARIWADIDLLLTSSTITEAWRLSRERRAGG